MLSIGKFYYQLENIYRETEGGYIKTNKKHINKSGESNHLEYISLEEFRKEICKFVFIG